MQQPTPPNTKTREIRWFFEQDRPGLRAFYEGLSPVQYRRETRVDVYMILPGREDLGIKIRQGRLELKFRTAGPETTIISPGIRGRAETWEKHGFELLPDRIPLALPGDSDASRISVSKDRWVTLVRVADGQLHFEIPGPLNPGSIQMEYTRIRFKGQQWYTLGFEWPEGRPFDLPESFLSKWVLPEGLSEGISRGYPDFLNRFKAGN
jgi:hypothetical protein